MFMFCGKWTLTQNFIVMDLDTSNERNFESDMENRNNDADFILSQFQPAQTDSIPPQHEREVEMPFMLHELHHEMIQNKDKMTSLTNANESTQLLSQSPTDFDDHS